jgi:hypothetical protein
VHHARHLEEGLGRTAVCARRRPRQAGRVLEVKALAAVVRTTYAAAGRRSSS